MIGDVIYSGDVVTILVVILLALLVVYVLRRL